MGFNSAFKGLNIVLFDIFLYSKLTFALSRKIMLFNDDVLTRSFRWHRKGFEVAIIFFYLIVSYIGTYM